MKFFVSILVVLSCFGLSAMQTHERARLAALVSELTRNCVQYLEQCIEKKESEFRVVAMQLFLNSEKERRFGRSTYLKTQEENITDRMAELAQDICLERQGQIIASVPFYLKNQRCFNCKNHKKRVASKRSLLCLTKLEKRPRLKDTRF